MNVAENQEEIKEMKPDVLFLDIEMGGLNGIETAKQIRAKDYLVQY